MRNITLTEPMFKTIIDMDTFLPNDFLSGKHFKLTIWQQAWKSYYTLRKMHMNKYFWA